MKVPSWALEDTFVGTCRYLRELMKVSSFLGAVFYIFKLFLFFV